jgi:hypothetical protein
MFTIPVIIPRNYIKNKSSSIESQVLVARDWNSPSARHLQATLLVFLH